jgi:hypothetical protein
VSPRSAHLSPILVVVALFTAHHADALELSWEAPAGCPNGDSVVAEVTRLTGKADSSGLSARANVSQTPDQRWRVLINLSGSAVGHRELTADTCAQLAKASALIVALAANPEAAIDLAVEPVDLAEVPEIPSSAPTSGTSARKKPPVSPPTSTQGSPPVDVSLLGQLGIEGGSLPTTTGLLRVGARVEMLPLSVVGALHVTQLSHTEFANQTGTNLRAFGSQLLVCAASIEWIVMAAGCVGGRLELLTSNGYGGIENYAEKAWLPSGILAVQLGLDFHEHWSLGLSSELSLPTLRPRFVVENVDSVLFQPEAMGWLFAVGLDYRL